MKIAILSCFYPYRGGISQFNACLMGELEKTCTVKAFNFKRQYPEFLFPGKTQYVSWDDNAVPVESESLLDTANPFSYGKTLRAIREWEPDLVLTRYWMSYFAPSLGYITRHLKKSCKVISILDNVVPHERRFFDTPLTKYFLKGSHAHVTMCQAVADDLLALKPQARYAVIPHPLYTHFGDKLPRAEAEKKLGIQKGKKNLLFFGLIREYKGLDILLKAFAALPEEYQLIVAGEPYDSFEKYERIIEADREITDGRIKLYLNYVNDSQVSSFFSAADAVVLPYRSATQSGIGSIALHFGVPMIVTDTGGLRETVEGTGTGVVVDRCTPEDIKSGIEKYFSNPGLIKSCAENMARERERLSWREFCRKLLEFSETI